MIIGNIWMDGFFWAAYAAIFSVPFYLPIAAFTCAAKGKKTTWRDFLMSASVLLGSVHVGFALIGLTLAPRGDNEVVYGAFAIAILALTAVVYALSVTWLGFVVVKTARSDSSIGEGKTAWEFVSAQAMVSALIVEITAGIFLVYGGVTGSLPNLSRPHLNPLSYTEVIPIGVSILFLAANFFIHLRNHASLRSRRAIIPSVAATSALLAALWWTFTWYFIVMFVIMFYVWVGQVFIVISRLTATSNVRYFAVVAALAAWVGVVWAFWIIADIRCDT